MNDLYTKHKSFIEANTITEHNMVPTNITQLEIASKLLPYFEIALINFGKKLYDCKIVDYYYRPTGGKASEILIDFSDQNSAAHLFATPITIPNSNNGAESFQVLLDSFFKHISSHNLDQRFREPIEDPMATKDISTIRGQLQTFLWYLRASNNINDPNLRNELTNLNELINQFKVIHPIESLNITQQNDLSTILSTTKIELENANRFQDTLQGLNSIEFKKDCFNLLTNQQNQITNYQQLLKELRKKYGFCAIPNPKVINAVQKIININYFRKVDQSLKNGLFDNGLITFQFHLKNPTEYWIFENLEEKEIEELIDIVYHFHEFLDLSRSDLNNFLLHIKANYKTNEVKKIDEIINRVENNIYEDTINEILAVTALKEIPLSSIDTGTKLSTFYFENFHYFSRNFKNLEDFNAIAKLLKNTASKNVYDIKFEQIINSFNVGQDIQHFITNDKVFLSEHAISQYKIVEQLEKKCLEKNMQFDILKYVFRPTNIQLAYMLAEYQLNLDKISAGYECYNDYLQNGAVKNTHNWLAIYYNLLSSQEFMNFIQTRPLIPNFAKTARKLSLITTICNIGELDYSVEIGNPTNGKRERNIYSLKFQKKQLFGNFKIPSGQQIILEIEYTGEFYKVNSLKTDAPVGEKTINGIKMLKIVYIVNEKNLALLNTLGFRPQADIIAPRLYTL